MIKMRILKSNFSLTFPDTTYISFEKNGKYYLVAGIVLTCDGGISVAPNMRMTTFENETEALTEYKVNFQFKF